MASLTKKQVLHVASLAKIPLTDDEVAMYTDQLGSVINYFEQLNEVDTKKVEPTHQTTGLTDVLRADEIDDTRILSVDLAVSQAEKVHNDYFVVPQLINQE